MIVFRTIMSLLLIASCSAMCLGSWPNSWAMWGTVSSSGLGNQVMSDAGKFLIARTESMVLLIRDRTSDDGTSKRSLNYATIDDPIGFWCGLEAARSTPIDAACPISGFLIGNSIGRKLGSDRVGSVQILGGVNPGGLGLFFESRLKGIRFVDVLALIESKDPNPRVLRNEYGELSVVCEGGRVEQMVYTQKANDLVGMHMPGMKMKDLPFNSPNGIRKEKQTLTFDPPIDSPTAPFLLNAEEIIRSPNRDDKTSFLQFQVVRSIVGEEKTAKLISKLLSGIPSGTTIVSDGPVEYAWADGRVKLSASASALEVADQIVYGDPAESTAWLWGVAGALLFTIGIAVKLWQVAHHDR